MERCTECRLQVVPEAREFLLYSSSPWTHGYPSMSLQPGWVTFNGDTHSLIIRRAEHQLYMPYVEGTLVSSPHSRHERTRELPLHDTTNSKSSQLTLLPPLVEMYYLRVGYRQTLIKSVPPRDLFCFLVLPSSPSRPSSCEGSWSPWAAPLAASLAIGRRRRVSPASHLRRREQQ